MKQPLEKRKPNGIVDHFALALTTWGVGYVPGAPGTYGSAIGVAIFLGIDRWIANMRADGLGFVHGPPQAHTFALLAVGLVVFGLVGIWAANRSVALLGDNDASEAVVDEVMGQLVTFSFIPFGSSWHIILAGFLLFRFFDIVKPYPARSLE